MLDFDALLLRVVETNEFSSWTEDSTASGVYRDYSTDDNPSMSLSRFGLWSWKERKIVKSLVEVAREVGVLEKGRRARGLDGLGVEDREGVEGEGVGDDCFEEILGKLREKNVNLFNSPRFQKAIAGEGEQRRKSREFEVEEIKRTFNSKEAIKSWKRESLGILWGYFQGSRKVCGEPKDELEAKKNFAKLMYELKARVVSWEKRDELSEDDTIADRVWEIRIPMWDVEALRDGKKKLVSSYCIEIAPKEGGAWTKVKKKIKHKQIARRAIVFGNSKGGEGVVLEGIEDAMSLYFCGSGDRLGLGLGEGAYYCVSAGKGNIVDAWAAAARLDNEGNQTNFVVQICDRDFEGAKGDSEAVAALDGLLSRSEVLQYIPREIKRDANASLKEGGVDGLKSWIDGLEEVQDGEIENSEEREAKEKELRAKEIQDLLQVVEEVERPIWTERGCAELWGKLHNLDFLKSEDGRVWAYDEHSGLWHGDDLGWQSRIYAQMDIMRRRYQSLIVAVAELDKDYDKGSRADMIEKFLAKLGTRSTEENVVKLILAHEVSHVKVNEFDSNPYIINVRNGVVDLRQGKLMPHSRDYMCSRKMEFSYKEHNGTERECKLFDRFLSDIMLEDTELIDYKWKQYAYIFSGLVSEKCIFMHYGETGNNGKSTEANILMEIMGSYASVIHPELLLENGNVDKDYLLADLPGVRLGVVAETSESKRWDEKQVKSLTGSDKATGRQIYKRHFSYTPVVKLMMHCNNLPKVRAGDKAFWNRIHLIPYEFSAENPDKELTQKILNSDERDLIGSRIVWAFQRYEKLGELKPVGAMLAGIQDYKTEGDDELMMFWGDEIEVAGGSEVVAAEVYLAYTNYCKRKGLRYPVSSNSFARFLTRMGVGKRRGTDGVKLRVGIALKSKVSDDDDGFFFN